MRPIGDRSDDGERAMAGLGDLTAATGIATSRLSFIGAAGIVDGTGGQGTAWRR